MIRDCLFLAGGFLFLVLGAHWLVDGAIHLAKRFKVSDWLIGLTVVAFGGSLPELVVNVKAVLGGNPDVAVANVFGSNAINICVALAIAAMIHSMNFKPSIIKFELPVMNLTAILIGSLIFLGSPLAGGSFGLSSLEGLLLLIAFGAFIFFITRQSMPRPPDDSMHTGLVLTLFLILIGFAGLFFGGQWIVDSGVSIAKRMGLTEAFIGFTIIAIGTSLPEIASSCVAARRKNAEIAVANVLGSNIFNFLLILGISASINPLEVNSILIQQWGFSLFTGLVLWLFIMLSKDNALGKMGGGVLLLIYVIYVTCLIICGIN